MDELPIPAEPPTPMSQQSIAAVPAGPNREIVLSRLYANFYCDAEPSLRARTLECLLRPISPLALVAVAAGAFSPFLHREQWGRLSVPIEVAMRFSSEQIFELARFVDQFQPEAFSQVAGLLVDNPVCLSTLTATLLLTAVRLWIPTRRPEATR
jgi:hypothetical protein